MKECLRRLEPLIDSGKLTPEQVIALGYLAGLASLSVYGGLKLEADAPIIGGPGQRHG